MKNSFLTFFLFISSVSFIYPQIPNAGFEAWTGNNPDGWVTNNFSLLGVPVTQDNNARSGSLAAKLEVIMSATSEIYSAAMTMTSAPVTEQFGSMNGYYQIFQANTEDYLGIGIIMFNGNSQVGAGSIEIKATVSDYTLFEIPINYFSTDIPDHAYITVVVSSDADDPTIGTYALLDDLGFGGTVDVKEVPGILPSKFAVKQNFPNPFNPSTTIEYSVPVESFVELKIYDIVGNEVATIVNENQSPGIYRADFNAAELSSGIYIARIQAGSFVKSFKMTLMK